VDSAPADLLPLGFLVEFSIPARSRHQLTRLDFPFLGGVLRVSQRYWFLCGLLQDETSIVFELPDQKA
jgi:hypothetical protein